MKKILALILVLCMALAALPALADEDFTGSWYLLQYGLTASSFELNADGTCSATTDTGEGDPQSIDGTWSADGDNVTITFAQADTEAQSMTFTYDGTDLVLGLEGLARAFGTEIPEGTDVSMFSALMKLSREPGKISALEFTAYQTDGTLPEGKTQEDMDAIIAEYQALAMSMLALMASSVDTSTGSDAGQESEAAAVLNTLEENFYVRSTYFGPEAVYIAKVQNTSEESVNINDGTLILKDAEGNEIARREWFGACGSRYLEPNEITVVSFIQDLEEGQTVADYEVNIKAEHNDYSTPDIICEVSDIQLRSKEGYSSTNYYTAATLTNAGEEVLTDVSVLFVLKDSEGKMIYVGTRDLGMFELGANSSITFVDDVGSSAVEYCEANGLTPGEVEAFAWQEIRNY